MFGELAKETLPCLTFGVVFGCLSWSFELELESGIGDLRTQCGKFLSFPCPLGYKSFGNNQDNFFGFKKKVLIYHKTGLPAISLEIYTCDLYNPVSSQSFSQRYPRNAKPHGTRTNKPLGLKTANTSSFPNFKYWQSFIEHCFTENCLDRYPCSR